MPSFFTLRRIFPLALLAAFAAPLLADEPSLAEQEEQAIRAAVEAVAPSVVRIETLGGLERVDDMLIAEGPTTGLIVSPEGHILSSAYNFIQQPNSILVTLPGGRRAAARIIARDRGRMLVLLKVDAPDPLPVPQIAPLSDVQVGQYAIALGRVYDGELPNVSSGIVSAVDRIWGKAIQSDAKISPANYGGPLIDIQGRVLGVLAPLSPQEQTEVAGAEWYDSGLGFAVPLSDLMPRLDTLKEGKDLHAGLAGIGFKSKDIYADAATIGALHPKSPADKAGLKVADTIVEADGHPIDRTAQLKHVLGRHYAGDKLKVIVKRGDERIEATLELTDKLVPYEHPFLGLLPERGPARDGAVVRWVYPASGAAEADLQAGDRVESINEEKVANADELRTALLRSQVGEEVKLSVKRGDETLAKTVKLSAPPTAIPDAPAVDLPPGEVAEKPATGWIDIVIPEEANKCHAYVPENYAPNVPHGLVVVLPAPGKFDQEELEKTWKAVCASRRLVLLTVQGADERRWTPTEAAVIRKAVDQALTAYTIDRQRIVALGHQAGGAMGFITAFEHRDTFRGVVAIDAPPPSRLEIPSNEPQYRIALLSAWSEGSSLAERIEAAVKRLREKKYPVTTLELGESPRALNPEEIESVARWIDSLDRI